MEENEVKTEQLNADDYLANLQALKDNTVSKDEYNKLVEDNRKLANALANGSFTTPDEDEKTPVDVDALKKRLFEIHKYKSDLDFFTDVLELRNAVMDRGEPDPILPTNPEYIPNQQDSDRAQFIADEIQAAIDYAEGDPQVFRVDLQRRCGAQKSRR